MFTLLSVELANSENFINEIAGFLRVLCVDKSYQAIMFMQYALEMQQYGVLHIAFECIAIYCRIAIFDIMSLKLQ